jgi:alcohol dehydrogenase, propanol-preferring
MDGWAAVGATMTPETKGIAGHEGVGNVVAVGDNMHERWKVGERAGIKWIWSICGHCEYCRNGGSEELHCPNQRDSGVNVPGTFQQYAVADGRYTTKIPDGVSDEEAAPLMCGGVTAYCGCKKSGVRAGQWVALLGAGGGLGHIAVQCCRVMVSWGHFEMKY